MEFVPKDAELESELELKPVLLNFSNHPASGWTGKQQEAAQSQFERIIDLAFPEVNPEFDSDQIFELANECADQIYAKLEKENISEDQPVVAHVMGEMTLVFQLVNILEESNIKCINSTSKRVSVDLGDGKKTSQFEFVKFRTYFPESMVQNSDLAEQMEKLQAMLGDLGGQLGFDPSSFDDEDEDQ